MKTPLPIFLLAICLLCISHAPAQTPVMLVGTNKYLAFSTSLLPGSWVYVDADPANPNPVRATQRSLGYREVDYKSMVPRTLSFQAVSPLTNAGVVTYDYSAQTNKTSLVGFWVSKDIPFVIGPDGNAYVTDGHHTTAGYLAAPNPLPQMLPGQNRVILGHIVANYFDAVAGPQPLTDGWWLARAAENNALLYGPDGDQLALPGEPGFSSLQPVLPSVLPMPITPSNVSTNGVVPMLLSIYRSLAWGLADGVVQSATDSTGKKVVGYRKSAPGSSVDINFVEFFWADYLRHRVVWDDSLVGSPFGSANGDASVTAAPLSFFAAVANGIALARSQNYRDEFGRNLVDYTNSAIFPPNTVNWAQGSLSNGLALASDTYNLYLRDDSTIIGSIQPPPASINILHIDTVAGLIVTQNMQNLSTVIINSGGTLKTSWKDVTVSNSTLRLPPGTGIVTITGTNYVATNTILGGGTLALEGTLNGNVQATNGLLQGHGTVNGGAIVQGTAILSPGPGLSTLTVNGPLTLSGACVLEVSKTGPTVSSDKLQGIDVLTYGGTLTVLAAGNDLASGDSFTLFLANSYRSAFSSFQLPQLPEGLAWDTTRLVVDGTIQVVTGTIAPALAAQPQSQTANVGATVKLLGGAVGTVPIDYQWFFKESPLTGQNGASLSLTSLQESNQGAYHFVASNPGGSVTSAVAIVTVNQAPTALAQALSVFWNTSTNILLQASDADGDALTFVIITPPAHGTALGTGLNITYQPATNYVGADNFTFRVSDGRLTATASISLTVKPALLAIRRLQTNAVEISWPQTSTSDVLEESSVPGGGATNWSPVADARVSLDSRWQVIIPAVKTNAIFRLRAP